MSDSGQNRKSVRRGRLLWAGLLAVIGLALLLVGLTVARGYLAWIEVALALVLLVASYVLQRVARQQSLYRDNGG